MASRTGRLTVAVLATVLAAGACSGNGGNGGGGATGELGGGSTATSAPNPAATTPTVTVAAGRRVTWENVTFTVPAAWQDFRGRDTFAAGPRIYDYRGLATGRINATRGFDATIDDLVPMACLRQVSNAALERPSAVALVESGFAPVGDRTAQYRRWSATCTAGVEEHRAWVLPVSRIAIYEVCHDNDTVAVASTALVAETTTAAPASRPPYANEIPGSCRNDLTDSATGT